MSYNSTEIAILMGTYNGSTFLNEQLQSFTNQTAKDWSLWVSDDGSKDDTLSLIEDYATQHQDKNITIFEGPKKGFSRNFLSLITKKQIKAKYYAFSDQDDIWFPEKLERAIKHLSAVEEDVPALYCSNTTLTDSQAVPTVTPAGIARQPSFENALVQNIAPGNTMVLNAAGRKLFEKCTDVTCHSHDWLAYILVSAAGGKVIYDDEPSIYYRQHDNNVIGMKTGFSETMKRVKRLIGDEYKTWIDQNLTILKTNKASLSEQNKQIIETLSAARQAPFFQRISEFKNLKLYRQTLLGNFALIFQILTKKI